jgi:hypothetical protein
MIKIKKYQIEDYISDSTQSSLNLKADLVGGKVPANQLPSFVDDVIEVANYAALPIPGATGVIYITLDTNKVYRWTGSVYLEIASGVTNLSYTPGVSNGTINSDTGNDATIPLADALNAGLFSATEKSKLAGIATGAEVNVNADWNATTGDAQILNKPTIPSISGLATVTYVDAQDSLKVDKIIGKGLSTEDYTSAEKSKLADIATGAEVNVNADWNAVSGDAQILNKPTITGTNTGDQNLQSVTDIGAITTNSITSNSITTTIDSTINGVTVGRGNVISTSNTVVGFQALQSIINTTGNEGRFNTAFGSGALKTLTTGYLNDAFGQFALRLCETGTLNLAVGNSAMANSTTATQNTAVGQYALQNSISGQNNTAIGLCALNQNTASYNTAIGSYAGGGVSSTGTENILVGYQSGSSISSGRNNLLIENQSGGTITSGSYNIILNPKQKSGVTTGSNNTIIGCFDNTFATGLTSNVILANGLGAIRFQSTDTGLTTVPAQTNTLINGDASGKAVVTKEYLSNSQTVFVPYTGATTDVDLGLNDITANSFIKEGGFDFQFLKADGSVDNNTYLTSADLPSTLDLYATTSPDPVIAGYTALVRNIADSRYNTTAVNVPTPTITGTLASPTFCGAVISDPSILLGNPGVFNFSVIGKIRRTGGSTSSGADFFFSIYKRDISGVETLIADSSPVVVPANGGIYVEYISIALWNNGIFLSTDRVVLKFYGIKSGTGSGATYEFLFGGADPVRGTAAISSAIIPNLYLRDLADVEKIDALNNEVLYWNDPASLWEHSLVENLVPDASATQKGLVSTGLQTIAGLKTFTSNIRLPVSLANTSATVVYGSPSTGELFIGFDSIGPTALEMQYVKGITSSVQTQLNGKQPTLTAGNGIDITSNTISTVNTSIGAYKILANNTNASAVPTEQVFKDITEKTLSNTNIVWTGTTAPSGTSNHTYRWSQVGRLVTLRVNLIYTTAANGVTMVSIPFDNMSDLPVPATVTGFIANGETFCFGTGLINTAKTAPSFTTIGVGVSAIRRNTSGTGALPYDLLIIRNTVNALVGTAYIQYYTT